MFWFIRWWLWCIETCSVLLYGIKVLCLTSHFLFQIFYNIPTLENKTNSLLRNVDNRSPNHAASYSKKNWILNDTSAKTTKFAFWKLVSTPEIVSFSDTHTCGNLYFLPDDEDGTDFRNIARCLCNFRGHSVAQLVKAPRYNAEGRGFDSRWCHWIFSLT